jgi:hypothetical protein
MDSLIIVSSAHTGRPVICQLGDASQAILTSDYDAPEAFELAAPPYVPDEGVSSPGEELPVSHATIILDEEEAYGLYQCLHALFQAGLRETDEESLKPVSVPGDVRHLWYTLYGLARARGYRITAYSGGDFALVGRDNRRRVWAACSFGLREGRSWLMQQPETEGEEERMERRRRYWEERKAIESGEL